MDKENPTRQIPSCMAVVNALETGTLTQKSMSIVELSLTPEGLKLIVDASGGYGNKVAEAAKVFTKSTNDMQENKKVMEDEEQKAWDAEQTLQYEFEDLNTKWRSHLEARSVQQAASKKKEAILRSANKDAGDILNKARKNHLLVLSAMQAGQKHKEQIAKVTGEVASKEEMNITQFKHIQDLNLRLEQADADVASEMQMHIAEKEAAERRAADLSGQYSAMATAISQASAAFEAIQAAVVPRPQPVVALAAGPSTA